MKYVYSYYKKFFFLYHFIVNKYVCIYRKVFSQTLTEKKYYENKAHPVPEYTKKKEAKTRWIVGLVKCDRMSYVVSYHE